MSFSATALFSRCYCLLGNDCKDYRLKNDFKVQCTFNWKEGTKRMKEDDKEIVFCPYVASGLCIIGESFESFLCSTCTAEALEEKAREKADTLAEEQGLPTSIDKIFSLTSKNAKKSSKTAKKNVTKNQNTKNIQNDVVENTVKHNNDEEDLDMTLENISQTGNENNAIEIGSSNEVDSSIESKLLLVFIFLLS